MKKKLIIFTHGGGRLANQLTNFAHLFAFWSENRSEFDVINLAFGPYADLFQRMKGRSIGYLPEGHDRLPAVMGIIKRFIVSRENGKKTLLNQVLRAVHFVLGIAPGFQSIKKGVSPNYLPFLYGKNIDSLDLQRAESLSVLRSAGVTLLAGWPIRSWTLFEKHQQAIREYFIINERYRSNAELFIASVRKERDLLIGVLMRQDDYRIWNDGKYFFSTNQYIEWMKQIITLFPDRNVGFVLASDEKQQIDRFRELPMYFTTGEKLGTSHFIESFTELSMCDYVLTPPSTFGIWAAFLGNIPIIPVFEKGQTLQEADILRRNLFDAIIHPHLSVSLQ